MQRYCITDSLEVAARAQAGMIQIRAKHLTARELYALVCAVLRATTVPVLVNTNLDVALAAGAAGVHLPSHSIAPNELRSITPPGFLIGVSCHTMTELDAAAREGASFAVFGPVFRTTSKPTPPIGLPALHEAAITFPSLPIYALGGITERNASLCIDAGAAGIAGISLFE